MEPDDVRKILEPSHTALLIWDVQRMLVDGLFNRTDFLTATRSLLRAARARNVPVFFSKITPLPERFESPVRKMFLKRMGGIRFSPGGLDLAIEPADRDTVIPKHTASMFVGTHFEHLLRNAGIGTIVLAGIATEIGIESTARDASNRGFFPVIATDAVSSRSREAHERSLRNMEKICILQTGAEIADIWGGSEA